MATGLVSAGIGAAGAGIAQGFTGGARVAANIATGTIGGSATGAAS